MSDNSLYMELVKRAYEMSKENAARSQDPGDIHDASRQVIDLLTGCAADARRRRDQAMLMVGRILTAVDLREVLGASATVADAEEYIKTAIHDRDDCKRHLTRLLEAMVARDVDRMNTALAEAMEYMGVEHETED